MKKLQKSGSFIRGLLAGIGVLACVSATHAAPYAGCITNLGGGVIQFDMNEGGANVYVVFGDGTSNVLGVLPAGFSSFTLPGTNTTYGIIASKLGTGIPFQYSSESTTNFTVWNNGVTLRAIDVNKNPTNAYAFGRVYIGVSGQSTAGTVPRERGIYGITPDLYQNAFFGGTNTNAISFANASNTNVPWGPAFNTGDGGFGSGPYAIKVMPDGTVWATDTTDAGAMVWQFGQNFEFTNQVLGTIGRLKGQAAGSHGNPLEVVAEGSIAAGNLVLWSADNSLFVPGTIATTNLGQTGIGNFGGPQETVVGDANEIYRYDIGAGPLPWTNAPVAAATLGLNGGFPDGQLCGVELGTLTNLVYGMFGRANFSDGNVQVFQKQGTTANMARLYTSLHGSPSAPVDVFNTGPQNQLAGLSDYGGLRVSPDGKYLAIYHRGSYVLVANLVNGIPDETSVFVITNTPQTQTGRELSWDAADNIYTASSGQAVVRAFSLGGTTTCITSNDITGNNGSFQLLPPPASLSLTKTGDASQNYGTPVSGNIKVNITTAITPLPASVTVPFFMSGTATNGVNYNIATGTDGAGVIVTTSNITFPTGFAGTSANIGIAPTPSPVSGPLLQATLNLTLGTNYVLAPPVAATVNITNTGPQVLFLTTVNSNPGGGNMNRGITNDYMLFVLNRWGDINGPGNSIGHILTTPYTVTNFTYLGTAVPVVDYTAMAQNTNTGSPIDGVPGPGVTIQPGVGQVLLMVGNPIKHNVLLKATNLTVTLTLTNAVTTTNGTSSEGFTYSVISATNFSSANAFVYNVSGTEFDNAVGGEVVLWSDPLTNAAATYAVTFASTNLASNNVPPVYIPSYSYTNGGSPNGTAASFPPNSNNFEIEIGRPVSMDGVPPSPVMAANGWTTAMRMTVNKTTQPGQQQSVGGVNLFPTSQKFVGNYALRFSMWLNVWSGALNNPRPSSFAREFADFGIGTIGTNCDWRIASGTNQLNSGNNPINADGMWYAIDAGDLSLTPADFDGFSALAQTNFAPADDVSNAGLTQYGNFKRPPFAFTDLSGGQPIDTWVEVSVETSSQTNVQLFIDRAAVIANMSYTNGASGTPKGFYTNGLPMLGYMDPYTDVSDESAFVYYSNVRMVELSPYIIQHPATNSWLVMAGTNLTINLTSTATYATAPLTNQWFRGATGPAGTALQTVSTNGTNLTDTFLVTSFGPTAGTNYFNVWSDPAGSVIGFVTTVSIISAPTNVNVLAGSTATFTITNSGRVTVTNFVWKTNGVTVVNSTKYSGATNISLVVANVQPADAAVTYTCTLSSPGTNIFGNLIQTTNIHTLTVPPISLTIIQAPSGAVVTPSSQTNLWGSSAAFSVTSGGTGPFVYKWSLGATPLAGATKYSGTNGATLTISNLTSADTGTYNVSVTNGAGNTTASGALAIFTPQPNLSQAVLVGGGNVAMSYTTTNQFETTNSFVLLSAPVVTGPYTNASGVFTTNLTGFTVTVPQGADGTMFYQLQHVQ